MLAQALVEPTPPSPRRSEHPAPGIRHVTLGAVSFGALELLLPQGADQFYNASLLPEVGAGRALRDVEQQPAAIAERGRGWDRRRDRSLTRSD